MADVLAALRRLRDQIDQVVAVLEHLAPLLEPPPAATTTNHPTREHGGAW